MRILILGKNGQLGCDLTSLLVKKNIDVISYSRSELDVTDLPKIISETEKIKPHIVINCTAYHVVPDCEVNPEMAFLINTVCVKNLAVVCQKMKIKFITYSTDYVFDGLKGTPYEENDRPNPLQIYGLSKLAGEFAALNYCDDVAIIRTCGVFGGKTGSRSKKGNFVLGIINSAKNNKKLEISSEQVVSPTYSLDLAEATYKLIKSGKMKGVYHLVNEGCLSWADFAQQIIKFSNIKCEVVPSDKSGMFNGVKKPKFSALLNQSAKNENVVLPHITDALKRYLESISL